MQAVLSLLCEARTLERRGVGAFPTDQGNQGAGGGVPKQQPRYARKKPAVAILTYFAAFDSYDPGLGFVSWARQQAAPGISGLEAKAFLHQGCSAHVWTDLHETVEAISCIDHTV